MAGCGMILGQFPFSMTVTSMDVQWRPLGKPILLVGRWSIDYAMTIQQVTGNAVAIPATGLCVARPEKLSGVNAASGSYQGTQDTTHHATDTSAVTDKWLAQCGVFGKLSDDCFWLNSCETKRGELPEYCA